MSVDHLARHQRREVGIAPQAQDGLTLPPRSPPAPSNTNPREG
jgi:hypothetical protein